MKIILCIFVWMLIQFHYFACSFYRREGIKIPLVYIFLVSAIVLALLGYIPRDVEVTAAGISVDYGIWIAVVGFSFLFTVGVRDVYFLLRGHKISSDPVEHNQITYVLSAIASITVFAVICLVPRGGEYPLSHIGNLVVACLLTYAVATHHLVDFRVFFRRGLASTLFGGILMSICLVWWFLFDVVLHSGPGFASVIMALLSTLVIYVIFGDRTRSVIAEKMEQVFYGEKAGPRRNLSNFIDKIYDAPTLEHFGSQLVSLLAHSIDCRRAFFLLPRAGDGDFVSRFNYPHGVNKSMSAMELRQDSPIVTWLRRESRGLSRREIETLPEFHSLWQEEKEDIQLAEVEMFVPLMHSDRLIAILAVSNKQKDKLYTVEDLDLIKSIADHVAVSMEKEYLREQVEEQREELTLINRLNAIMTSGVNIEVIFENFARELDSEIGIDYASIALIEEEHLRILALFSQLNSGRQVGDKIPFKGSVAEWIAEHKASLYQANLEHGREFADTKDHIKQGIRCAIHLPLIVRGEVVGTLLIASNHPDAYTSGQIRTLEHLASQIAMPIENTQLYARAEQRARIDELTGLFNRRHFEERFREEIARHSRRENSFSLLMLDLDSFKTYNDIYGHPSGDQLLNQVGRIIKGSIRSADQAFRYGGDEFVVILPETDVEDAYVVAERTRERIATEMGARQIAVTCSGGLANYPSDGMMYGELVTMADTALYYAKRTGGNRVYLSSKILSESTDGEMGVDARKSGLSTVYALASAVDAKDHYTYGHSRKVNAYAVALAEAIGVSPEEVSRISAAALLHDVGKIGVPDKILTKKGELSTLDWEAIRSHPTLGANIVRNVPSLAACVNGVLYHHERWDGTGYPEGLKGDRIPLDARILAIADAFAAMISARPYRDALSGDKVIEQLRQGAGKQFDPGLVEIFISIVEAELSEKAEMGQELSGKAENRGLDNIDLSNS
ncbi:MAG: diguanylate cyclase [Dehalococcoidia bacterium]|nr:diguanylate cyclase [Dehalococcoidia bacterium]